MSGQSHGQEKIMNYQITLPTGIVLVATLFLIGCENKAKSQIEEGLLFTSDYKTRVAEYFANTGSFPEDGEELGVSDEKLRFVEDISIDNGAITIVYGNEADEEISGEQLTLKPVIDANTDIVWVCGYALYEGSINANYPESGPNETTVPQDLLPKNCQGPAGWKASELDSDDEVDAEEKGLAESDYEGEKLGSVAESTLPNATATAPISQSTASERWLKLCQTLQDPGSMSQEKIAAFCACTDNAIRGVSGPLGGNMLGPASEDEYSAFVDLMQELVTTQDETLFVREGLVGADGSTNFNHPASRPMSTFGTSRELCQHMVRGMS